MLASVMEKDVEICLKPEVESDLNQMDLRV